MIESSDELERRQMTERRRLTNDNDALIVFLFPLALPRLCCQRCKGCFHMINGGELVKR